MWRREVHLNRITCSKLIYLFLYVVFEIHGTLVVKTMRFAFKSSHSIDWPLSFVFIAAAVAASVTTFVWCHSSKCVLAPLQQLNQNQFDFILFVCTSLTQSNHHFWHSFTHSLDFIPLFLSFAFFLFYHFTNNVSIWEKNHFIEVKQFIFRRLIHDNNVDSIEYRYKKKMRCTRENKNVNNVKLFTVDMCLCILHRCIQRLKPFSNVSFLCFDAVFVVIVTLIGIKRRSISILFRLHNKCVWLKWCIYCWLHACCLCVWVCYLLTIKLAAYYTVTDTSIENKMRIKKWER